MAKLYQNVYSVFKPRSLFSLGTFSQNRISKSFRVSFDKKSSIEGSNQSTLLVNNNNLSEQDSRLGLTLNSILFLKKKLYKKKVSFFFRFRRDFFILKKWIFQ